MGSRCLWKGERVGWLQWEVLYIWRCILSLPGAKTGTAGEGQDHWSGRHHRILPLVLKVTRVTLNATPLRFSTHGPSGDILKGSFYLLLPNNDNYINHPVFLFTRV